VPVLFAEQEPGTTRTLLEETDSAGAVVPTVRRSVLRSGLRVVTEAMPGVRSAAVGVWVGTGARDESPRLSGASHFLEHLLFKGTPTRSAMEISSSLDAVGGEFNAFTAREYTCFHARVLDDDLPLAVDVLGDMITSSVLQPADVEAEREVILDELAMHDDDPEDVVANLFAATAWGEGPLGRPVGGRPETVAGISCEQVTRFYRCHYIPDNIVVSVAGNVDHDEIVKLVSKAFAFHDSADAPPRAPRAGTPYQPARAGSARLHRSFEQANAVLGFDGIARGDERRFALGVLTTVLGGGSSSRLFQEVRERRGLTYSIYAYPVHTADSGALCVGLGCLPDKLDQVVDVVRHVLGSLRSEGVTPEELARGKGQVRGSLVLGLEDSASRMARIAKADLLNGELISVDETLERVAAVAVADVHAMAEQILGGPEILAVVGPEPGPAVTVAR
jgi:predicted Zn-dependent peptidase